MILLGIDHGEKRLGLAINDGNMTFGYGSYTMTGKKDLDKIAELIKSSGAEKVIVGLPLRMSGKEGQAVKRVQEFIEGLKSILSLEIETWDERLTTQQAERILNDMNISRAKVRNRVDTLAAVLILDSYIQAHKNNKDLQV